MFTIICPNCRKEHPVEAVCKCHPIDTDSPRLLPGDLTDALAGYPVTKVRNAF